MLRLKNIKKASDERKFNIGYGTFATIFAATLTTLARLGEIVDTPLFISATIFLATLTTAITVDAARDKENEFELENEK